MKLKKIASLALAGIMAVSMLAGCKDGGNSNSGSSSSETTGTASGYSAMLAEELKDTAAKKYVTFADNNSDKTALEDWLGNFANSFITAIGSNAYGGIPVTKAALTTYVDDLEDAAGLNGYTDDFRFADNLMMLGTWKVGKLYVADGSVDIEKVIKNIAASINDTTLSGVLVDTGTSNDNTLSVKYSYVVSASVVNVKDTENLQMNQSTNVILVTITRTGVAE